MPPDHLVFPCARRVLSFYNRFPFYFHIRRPGAIGLYNGLVIKFCLLQSLYTTLPCPPWLLWKTLVVLDAQSLSSSRSLHSHYFSAAKKETAARTWLKKPLPGLITEEISQKPPRTNSPSTPLSHPSASPKTLGSCSCGSNFPPHSFTISITFLGLSRLASKERGLEPGGVHPVQLRGCRRGGTLAKEKYGQSRHSDPYPPASGS